VRGCGPHRAALAKGGNRAKIVLKNHVKIQIVISYAKKTKHYSCVRFDFVGIAPILCRGRSIPNISPFFS